MTEQAQQGDTADMVGQDPATNEPTGQAPAGDSDVGQAPVVDASRIAALEQELAKYRSEAEKARQEAAARRIKAKEEAEAKAKALEEQGQFKALADERAKVIEEMKAELEALSSLRDKAERYDQYEQRKLKEIEDRLPSLPADVQEAVNEAPSLDLKRKILRGFDALQTQLQQAQPGKSPARPAPSGAAPGSPPAAQNLRNPTLEQLQQIQRNDPTLWERLTGRGSSASPNSIGARLAGGARK